MGTCAAAFCGSKFQCRRISHVCLHIPRTERIGCPAGYLPQADRSLSSKITPDIIVGAGYSPLLDFCVGRGLSKAHYAAGAAEVCWHRMVPLRPAARAAAAAAAATDHRTVVRRRPGACRLQGTHGPLRRRAPQLAHNRGWRCIVRPQNHCAKTSDAKVNARHRRHGNHPYGLSTFGEHGGSTAGARA
jgi:hypothetical protein